MSTDGPPSPQGRVHETLEFPRHHTRYPTAAEPGEELLSGSEPPRPSLKFSSETRNRVRWARSSAERAVLLDDGGSTRRQWMPIRGVLGYLTQ